jgi:hypothetical protein
MGTPGSYEGWFTQRRRRLMASVLAGAELASLPRSGRAAPIVPANTILRNGRILTVNPGGLSYRPHADRQGARIRRLRRGGAEARESPD